MPAKRSQRSVFGLHVRLNPLYNSHIWKGATSNPRKVRQAVIGNTSQRRQFKIGLFRRRIRTTPLSTKARRLITPHHKNIGWYFLLVLALGVASALLYLITRDMISVVAVVILAVVFGVSAGRKPRILNYQLDRAGLTVGQRFYSYGNFKSFSLVNEGAFTSIMFMPLKRFMPAVSIYFSPEDEEKIVEVLSAHLPLQQGEQDAIDKLMHRIRF